MKGVVQRRFRCTEDIRGFTVIELGLVIVVLAMLVGMHLPFYSRLREGSYIVVDQNNIRQILRASAIYAAENDERLAHPTWGADVTGPDGWAYLTSKAGRAVPGALQNSPSTCAGKDVNSSQFTNQLAFFKVGQVTQYLPDVKAAWCPKDVATRGSGRLRSLWLGRPVKVTSYIWTANIGGYIGPQGQPLLNGRTYKVSQFLPGDWQMWEGNENDPFYFNDAASNPEAPAELLSLRHSGMKQWWTFTSPQIGKAPGAGIVGTFDGGSKPVNFQRAYDLATSKVPSPNELLNGPRYQR